VQAAAGSHPDVTLVSKPKDKSFLPLELLIGDKEHRRRRGLCHDISLKPFMGRRKVAVIDDADYLNIEGANSLLKTLEEPPPHSVLILIGTSPAKQLPTIRSRCQLIRFKPLATELVAQLLCRLELIDDPRLAERLASYSSGSLQRALEMADSDVWEFRDRLYRELAAGELDPIRLSEMILQFVDAAGREAPARRERIRLAIALAAEFYRYVVHGLNGRRSGDDDAQAAVHRAVASWGAGEMAAAACLDRCLEAGEQVDRNANQATLLECWLDDLAGILTPTG
jgi:DNA polymerase-3 subunit delta'